MLVTEGGQMSFENFEKYIKDILQYNKYADQTYSVTGINVNDIEYIASMSENMLSLLELMMRDSNELILAWLYDVRRTEVKLDGISVAFKTIRNLYDVLNIVANNDCEVE